MAFPASGNQAVFFSFAMVRFEKTCSVRHRSGARRLGWRSGPRGCEESGVG